MYEASQAGTDQRYGQNGSGGEPVRHDTAKQVGNHAEYAQDASENTHLGICQVVYFQICVIVVIPEIRKSVNNCAAEGNDDDCPEVSGHLFIQTNFSK